MRTIFNGTSLVKITGIFYQIQYLGVLWTTHQRRRAGFKVFLPAMLCHQDLNQYLTLMEIHASSQNFQTDPQRQIITQAKQYFI